MCFWFCANVSGDFDQFIVDIVSQTSVIRAMVVAAQIQSNEMQQTITWLASNLMNSDVITIEERVQICGEVGKPSFKSLNDKTLSDVGYLFQRAFEKIGNLEEELSLEVIEKVCVGSYIIGELVK